jgi:hypothetical protein
MIDRATVSRFVDTEGHLHTIPTRRAKRLQVLDWLVQRFELGKVYPEAQVSEMLERAHPDYAALRRYLVEEDFLTREDGFYWRSGGTVDF